MKKYWSEYRDDFSYIYILALAWHVRDELWDEMDHLGNMNAEDWVVDMNDEDSQVYISDNDEWLCVEYKSEINKAGEIREIPIRTVIYKITYGDPEEME